MFDRIALSLSGGGYRAAAFHLGALRTLHRLGLLGRVRALSTASGGTIIGAFYAQCLAEGLPFEEFDRRAFAFLRDIDVIDAALRQMPASRRHGRAKLIVAAAEVYASALFHATLGDLRRSEGHLEEISFNATELTRGIAFRFIRSPRPRVRSGNRFAPVPHEVADGIRLADVVAASSCFPAAFEPLVFPDDFRWRGAKPDLEPVPLMDGGIFDNQGIESLLLVRARRGAGVDRVIVSDADRGASPLYMEPRARGEGFVRVWMVLLAILGLGVAAAISAYKLPLSLPFFVSAVAALVSAAVLVRIALLMGEPVAGRTRPLLWRHVLRLKIAELSHALRLRGSSLVALTSRVFMKRVRNLMYQRVYERPSLSDRAISNLIYELIENGPDGTVRAMAERASSMPTVLWFDDESQLREVVAVGEMTMCFNLVRHLEADGGELYERCAGLWHELTRRP